MRRLSDDEIALWKRVAASARRLVPGAEPATPPVARQPAAPPPPDPAPRAAPTKAAGPAASPQLDRRRLEKLRRGRFEPEARLDLHGMTSARAHAALERFIMSAHASGLRLVLVITGKGREGGPDAIAPHRHGILRHSVPHWLAAPPLASRVLQVLPAHQRHGGAGACYVYLRRNRT